MSAQQMAAFDAAVEPLRQALDVPGVAVAIVDRGKTVFAQGYGLRDLESGDPVTPDTVFRIGSLTKSFSSALIATCVDDGVVGFDTRAIDIDPAFATPSADLTNSLTIQQLLGMGTGLSDSGLWCDYPTPEDLVASLATAPLTPEGTYLYSNEVYASGTYLALEAEMPPDDLATAYARLIDERLFQPIGMSPAAVTDDPTTVSSDVAASYGLSLVAGPAAPERTGFTPLGSVAPAGAIVTNVTSMARYAAMQLAGGVAGKKRVVSAENLAVTHAAQTPVSFPDAPWLSDYAAGWIIGNEGGVSVLWHDGAVDGYSGTLRLLPDDDRALVVLTNGWNGEVLAIALEEKLMQLLYGQADLGPDYYTGAYATERKQLVAVEQALTLEAAIDPAAVAPFLGDYSHRVSVELDSDSSELFVVLPGSKGRVVRADRLFKTDGAYLVASGPFSGTELLFQQMGKQTELTVVDPASGTPVLTLVR
jgi:CubicO group peptidase (beta-lactamase class C family)